MKFCLRILAVSLAIPLASASVAMAASSPTVSTAPATSIHSNTAVLHGAVKPNSSLTFYRFEYGLTGPSGAAPSALAGTSYRVAGSGTASVSVAASLSGLFPGTSYSFRVDAINKYGTTMSAFRSFRTAGPPPPAVATGPALVTGPTSAAVTGEVNPNGKTTTYWFQYGSALQPTTYDSSTPPQTISGTATVTVSARLFGLAPRSPFHFRLVAQRSDTGLLTNGYNGFFTFPTVAPTPRVTASTTPGRVRHRPFVFTTTGRLIGPSDIPAGDACAGTVRVRFMLGKRRVSLEQATVLPNCTFSVQTVFNRKPGRGRPNRKVRLRVLLHFTGNGYATGTYLAPADGRGGRVTLG